MKVTFFKVLATKIWGKLSPGMVWYERDQEFIIRKQYKETHQSPSQAIVRKVFNSVDDAFLTLSNIQIYNWRITATRRKKGSNYAYFMSFNVPRALAGEPILLDPPP